MFTSVRCENLNDVTLEKEGESQDNHNESSDSKRLLAQDSSHNYAESSVVCMWKNLNKIPHEGEIFPSIQDCNEPSFHKMKTSGNFR